MIATLALTTAMVTQTAPIVARLQTFDHVKPVAVAAAQSGPRFATSDYQNTIRVIDASTRNNIFTLKGHPQPAFGLAFTPDGKFLVSGDETARIYVWDMKTGKKVREFPRTPQTHARGIQYISFSSDGKTMLSTGKDDTIVVWDFAGGKPTYKIAGNGVVFASAQFGTSNVLAPTLTEGLHVRKGTAYGLASRLNGHKGQGVCDMAINSAKTRIITGGRDMDVAVWDGKAMKKMSSLAGHQDYVQHVAMAPNGRVAASSANDRTVIIWDIVKMAKIGMLKDQCAVGSPICFTGDGKYLISVNVNDSLQINTVTPGQGVATPVAKPKPKTKSRRKGRAP